MLNAVGGDSAAATDTGGIGAGRLERTTTSFDLTTGAFDNTISAATGPLGTGFLSNNSNTGAVGTGNLTGPLKASDANSSLKIKVDGKSGRRRRIPVGAIVLIIIAIALYAFAAYMFFVK